MVRVTVDLVQVDVTVTDRQGRHVTGLTAADFELFEDGKSRKITAFSHVQGSAPAPTPSQAANIYLASPPKPLQPDQVARTIVVLADTFSLSFASTNRLRTVLNTFVDRQIQPGDLVSIVTADGGMGVLQQFTNDKRLLHASIDRIVWSPFRSGMRSWDAVQQLDTSSASAKFRALESDLAGSQSNRFLGATFSALNFAVEGLGAMPGRKAIVFFSDGLGTSIHNPDPAFLTAINRTAELANRSSVVFYMFDARGLIAPFGDGDGFFERVASQNGLIQLARKTGGLVFLDNNGLSQSLAVSLQDMGSYYLLAFQPEPRDFNRKDGRLQFHKLRVEVKRPDVRVRSREGFSGTPDDFSRARPATPRQQLRAALYSPFLAADFPLRLSAFYSARGAAAPKRHGFQSTLRAMLVIDAREIPLQNGKDGKKRLVFDVAAGVWGADNRALATFSLTSAVENTPEAMARAVSSGLAVEMDIPLPKPGPYQLRAAVREEGSNRMGSATSFVDIPDFNRPALSLSSVLISDPDPKRARELEDAGVIGAGSPVTRVFAPGAVMDYRCDVFGTREKSQLELEFHLFRGTEPVFSGQPIPVPPSAAKPLRATGKVNLPASLLPGDYSIEFIAHDTGAAAKSRSATQWIDFTLMPGFNSR